MQALEAILESPSFLYLLSGLSLISAIITISDKIRNKIPHFPSHKEDPYLRNYAISAIIITIVLIICFNLSQDDKQIRIYILSFFGYLVILAAIGLCWRYIHVKAVYERFGKAPNEDPFKINFLPYFILLGPFFALTMTIIFYFTQSSKIITTRPIIVAGFLLMTAFLFGIRVGWSWIDYRFSKPMDTS